METTLGLRWHATAVDDAPRRHGIKAAVAVVLLVLTSMSMAGRAHGATPPPWSASNDPSSMFNIVRSVGANQLWNQHFSGQGVGVALLDTGVAPVDGLDQSGQIVNGPDLSLDAGDPSQRYLDDFGHGTHMAGIIAGRDSAARNYGAYNDPKYFTGVAPDATIVSVKVGASDGSADVSQVIAGLDWVVAHKDDPGVNIRVVNLAYGTNSTQSYQIDPLAYAVERAWKAGIVVVVAAGNDGNSSAVLTDPAVDPYVIAVGADGHYDKDGNKMYMTDFSNAGNPDRSPDLVAPGNSIVSLRDPGSFVDTFFPGGMVNDPAARFFRGSGTSQATSVVSGVVADLISKYPTLTPDQVKGLLIQTAHPLTGVSKDLQGAGEIDAAKLAGVKVNGKTPSFTQSFTPSDGSGSLEAARGGNHLVAPDGTVLRGENTVFGPAFDGSKWTNNAWDAASWQAGSWSGSKWTGDTWSSHDWSSDPYGQRQYGDAAWAGSKWTGSKWTGSKWTGSKWSGSKWTDGSWTGNNWSGSDWG